MTIGGSTCSIRTTPSQQRLLRIVYRSLPTDPDRTERILDDSGVLAHPNIVAVPIPT